MCYEESNYPDRYKSQGLLRRHGNGTLIAVRDRRDGAWYVEKKYHQNIAQALLEIERLNEIQHKYIHNFVEGWQDEHGMWASIWFEPFDQGTLSGLINRHSHASLPIFEHFCWKVFWQIAKGMRYCHRLDGQVHNWHPIIHRNLTPQNILLVMPKDGRPTPDVKITGFECAVRVDYPDENLAGLRQVNCEFVPPEAPHYCEASDVYQIGCIMACIFNLILRPEPMSSSGMRYSEELRAIVRACLKKTPENRYRSDRLATLVRGGKDHANSPICGRLLFCDGPLDVNL